MSDLTLDRLKAWLADEGNFLRKTPYPGDLRIPGHWNGIPHTGVRRVFVTANGYEISIQQSASHYCSDENEVEMWHCPPSPLLALYGDGDDPYAHVPLEVVAGYIDSIETLPPKEKDE